MTGFKIGECVNVGPIIGARITDVSGLEDSELTVTIECDAGDFPITLPLGVVEVKRSAPAEWPPQAGDVWQEAGDFGPHVWFVQRDIREHDSERLLMVPREGGDCGWSADTLEKVAARGNGLTLLYRVPVSDAKDGGQGDA